MKTATRRGWILVDPSGMGPQTDNVAPASVLRPGLFPITPPERTKKNVFCCNENALWDQINKLRGGGFGGGRVNRSPRAIKHHRSWGYLVATLWLD